MTQYLIEQASDPIDKLVHQVESSGPVEVIRAGKLVAVLMSAEDYRRSHNPKKNFMDSLLEIRQRYGLDDRNLDESDISDAEFDEVFNNLRDKSPGREVEL
jgi:prevent-host-death family protein